MENNPEQALRLIDWREQLNRYEASAQTSINVRQLVGHSFTLSVSVCCIYLEIDRKKNNETEVILFTTDNILSSNSLVKWVKQKKKQSNRSIIISIDWLENEGICQKEKWGTTITRLFLVFYLIDTWLYIAHRLV